MTAEPEQSETVAAPSYSSRPLLQMWRVRLSLGLILILACLAALAWSQRKDIADNVIADELAKLGLPATYQIERIGGQRQVLTNIVIGDPAHPDMTIERARVSLVWDLFAPRIDLISLTKPRLYGTYRNGKLSFGSLDPLIFDPESTEPPALPDIDLELIDGRALLESDFGAVGFKVEGTGNLASSFKGMLAANAPSLAGGGCNARGATLYGKVSTAGGKARFDGPIRLDALACPAKGLSVTNAALALVGTLDKDFAGFDGKFGIEGEKVAYSGTSLAGMGGSSSLTWRKKALTARYDLAAQEVLAGPASLRMLGVEGDFRSRDNFASWEAQASVKGERLQPGAGIDALLASKNNALNGTLLAPLLQRASVALEREGRGSRLTADVTVRSTGDVVTAVVPQATLRGTSGAILLALSRFQLSTAGIGAGIGAPRFSGNFATGGRDLPRIAGRMERQPSGKAIFRLNMAEYSAGTASLALPELLVSQNANGAFGFAGRLIASGPLPGGATRNLILPISGSYSAGGQLALWQRCTDVKFDQLTYANLTLERREITLCPRPGGAIVRAGKGGFQIAAGAPSLKVSGRLGATPLALTSGPIGLAYPGALNAKNVDIALGPSATATRFRLSGLDARLGGEAIAGTFSGTDVFLDAVPLDILDASGEWTYAGGKLTLSEGVFRLEDREREDRFQPLVARGATLALENSLVTARASLRNPASDRIVSDADIVHSLETGAGYADLAVAGLVLDGRLQADQLTRLALGVVANTYGTVTGTGRIDWNADEVTSSGSFTSNNFDLAAAFGPVKGASGTIVFTDLLNLTTAPNQVIRIASVNPGIEVFDGELTFQLKDREFLSVKGGVWPFMGGSLKLAPVNMKLGAVETRKYELVITGLQAAQFIQQMELSNLAATGTFDGTMPLIFDENGGRIEGGLLVSRVPGGNLSYVGALTYEDMNPYANFAFDALRSLNFREMRVAMDGSLTGELVTRVRFDGVKQGEGTKRNFITRQIARLPVRLNVNIRAPFYKLITSVKAMYDPASIRDPRDLGLVGGDGRIIRRQTDGETVPASPSISTSDEAPIQTPESESSP